MYKKSWLSVLITALVGILLIIFYRRGEILSWVVMLFGACLVIPGLYNLFTTVRMRNKLKQLESSTAGSRNLPAGSLTASIVASVAGIALGVWMLLTPDFFVGLIVYVFGALLLLYGVYELVFAAWLSRPYRLPYYFYLMPILMIVGGIVILCTTIRTMNQVMMLLTGILLLASVVNSTLEYMSMHPATRRDRNDV